MTKQINNFGKFKTQSFSFAAPRKKEKKDPVVLNEHQQQNREMMKQYNKTMENAFDSEFWCAITFPSKQSMQTFLDKLHIRLSDVGDGEIIDGGLLRKHLRNILKKGKRNG